MSHRLRRRASLAATFGVVAATLSLPLLSSSPALADTTSTSTVTGTGTDATNASTAVAGTRGTAKGGDTLNWVMNYANNHTSPSDVTFNSQISGAQTLVPASQVVPTGTTATSSAGNVGFTATNYTPASKAISPGFQSTPIGTLATSGGDGWNGVGIGSQIYSVYHHLGTPTVYCANLDGSVCANWPNGTHNYSPPSATGFTTSMHNGTFIDGSGKLHWPEINRTADATNEYPWGLGCLDTATQADCGFIPLAHAPALPGSVTAGDYSVTGDGVAATNGNFYYVDGRGDVACFNTAACTGASSMFGAHTAADGAQGSLTIGQYFFATIKDSATSHAILGCFDTATDANCTNYPVDTGVVLSGNAEVDPLLDQNGAAVGACSRGAGDGSYHCYSVTDGTATMASPYPTSMGGPFTYTGQGAIVGNRFYMHDSASGNAECYEFSAPGVAAACAGFTPQPGYAGAVGTAYTQRPLANLPGCLISDADDSKIQIYDGQSGGPCPAAKQSATLAPLSYCDGAAHSTTWGRLTTPGLTGSEYIGGTVTLKDSQGNAVAGWSGKSFTGPLDMDLSSIATTGATAGLTATVMLTGITPDSQTTATVAAATVQMTRTGDTYSQLCYQTQVDPGCHASGVADSFANAVTTNNKVADPANYSGHITFNLTAGAECMLHITKKASTGTPQPGQVVTFTIVISNTGTTDYTAAAPAIVRDNMSNALRYAAYDKDAVATAGTTSYTAPTLSWTGPIAHGTSVTLRYTMKVAASAPAGVRLVNVVASSSPSNCGSGSSDPVCRAAMSTTKAPLKIVKTESTASPSLGGVIKYTITITNVGRTDYPASGPAVAYDRMQGVLPYASWVSGKASSGGLRWSGTTLIWSGALLHGHSVTVVYYLKVKSSATGQMLRNYVQSPDPSNCTKGTENGCHVAAYVAPSPAHTGV